MRRNLFSKAISIILCWVLLFAIPTYTNATTEETRVLNSPQNLSVITPFYTYISTTSTTLSISSGTATCYSRITGIPGTTTKVTINMTLQKKSSSGSWSSVSSWSSSNSSYSASLSKTYSVSKGTYRVKAAYTAYRGTLSESSTKYSSEKAY